MSRASPVSEINQATVAVDLRGVATLCLSLKYELGTLDIQLAVNWLRPGGMPS